MKKLITFFVSLLFALNVFSGEHDTIDHHALTFTMVVPPELVEEGYQLWMSHAKWMKSSHFKSGPKALHYYEVSTMDELSDPLDFNSKKTGNVIFVLHEVYKSVDGIQDHFNRTPEFKDWPKLEAWMNKVKMQKVANGTIFNSLTWGSGVQGK